jgi:hypothetical protein
MNASEKDFNKSEKICQVPTYRLLPGLWPFKLGLLPGLGRHVLTLCKRASDFCSNASHFLDPPPLRPQIHLSTSTHLVAMHDRFKNGAYSRDIG